MAKQSRRATARDRLGFQPETVRHVELSPRVALVARNQGAEGTGFHC